MRYETVDLLEVTQALDELKDVPRPDADNEFEPIDHPDVFDNLSAEQQEKVGHAQELLRHFLDENGIKGAYALTQAGYNTTFHSDTNTGRVEIPPKAQCDFGDDNEDDAEEGEAWELRTGTSQGSEEDSLDD